MPLKTSKTILMVSKESSESVYSSPVVTDAVRYSELPTYQFDQETKAQLPAGGTLTPEASVAGRRSATSSVVVDLAGSGTPSTEPRWGRLLEACGMRKKTASGISNIQVTSPTNGPFLLGEEVDQTTGGENAIIVGVGLNDVYIAWESGLFETTESMIGVTSLANESALGAVLNDQAIMYVPDSEVQVTITSTAITPLPVVGDVIHFNLVSGGVAKAGGVCVVNATSTTLIIKPSFGVISASDNIANVTTSQASIESVTTVSQSRGPSVSWRQQVDGVDLTGTGKRGDWSLSAAAGETAKLTCNFSGQHRSEVDAVPVAPSGSDFGSTATPPIMGGSSLYIDGLLLRVRSLNLSANQNVSIPGDMNQAGGSSSASITSRSYQLQVDVEAPPEGTFGFAAAKSAQTIHRVAFQIGTPGTGGNWITFVLPSAQVSEHSYSDDDGIASISATFNSVLADTTVFSGAPAGDNELIICHL